MAAIQVKYVHSALFLPGNFSLAAAEHEENVNAFLITIPDPQDVLDITHSVEIISDTQRMFLTVIAYHQP